MGLFDQGGELRYTTSISAPHSLRKDRQIHATKVSAQGQIVIPASLREKYGLEPGSTVEIFDAEGRIILFPGTKDPVEEARGMLAGDTSLVQELLNERAKELEREEAKLRRW